VIRVTPDHVADWVNVQTGRSEGGKMEIFARGLNEGDRLVTKGTEEIRNGSVVNAAQPTGNAEAGGKK
jgi:hypothetical protein